MGGTIQTCNGGENPNEEEEEKEQEGGDTSLRASRRRIRGSGKCALGVLENAPPRVGKSLLLRWKVKDCDFECAIKF